MGRWELSPPIRSRQLQRIGQIPDSVCSPIDISGMRPPSGFAANLSTASGVVNDGRCSPYGLQGVHIFTLGPAGPCSALALVGHDAFGMVRLAQLIDEELPQAAAPGPYVCEQLLQVLDAAGGEGCDAVRRPVVDVDHLAVGDVVGVGGDDLDQLGTLAGVIGERGRIYNMFSSFWCA